MHLRSVCSYASVLGVASTALGGPIILNGDMDGFVGMGVAPQHWTATQLGTPDVANESGPFNNTGVPWTLSPNGGTFARLNGVGNDQSEGLSQIVTGFIAGETYEISFYAANLGFRVNGSGAWLGFDGFLEFYADGELVATSETLSKQSSSTTPIEWFAQSIQFEATSSEFVLEIRSETVGQEFEIAYMALDGVNASIVPAPGTLAAFAGLGLVSTRRRR